MKNIRVYDLKPLLNGIKHNGNDLEIFGYDSHGLAIIVGEKGVVAFDCDGIGKVGSSIEDKYSIRVSEDLRKHGAFQILPIGTVEVSYKEIIERCKYKEVLMSNFVRVFGSRIEQNFAIMIDAIDEIGENSQEYHMGRYRTDEEKRESALLDDNNK